MYWEKIHNHIKNKFNNPEKVKQTKTLPIENELEKMQDNLIYKVPFISLAVDVVDFKKMSIHTDPEIFSKIMSEFTYGTNKILKKFNARSIRVKEDGIFATFQSNKKTDIDNAFFAACSLATFNSHLSKMIDNYFPEKLKNSYSSYYPHEFKFGIGIYLGWKNYISKIDNENNKELVYMGKSVNYSNVLAKKANRKLNKQIFMNKDFKNNFTEEQSNKANKIGGFLEVYIKDIKEYAICCNWIVPNYNNFVENKI